MNKKKIKKIYELYKNDLMLKAKINPIKERESYLYFDGKVEALSQVLEILQIER